MTDFLHEELFVEPKSSLSLKLIAAIAALVVTVALFVGYAYLRRRHVENTAPTQVAAVEPRKPPKAVIRVDDALLSGSNRILSGTVTNTSTENLEGLSVELELKRRKDGVSEKKLVALQPSRLEPQQEGRYSLQLPAHEYASARLVALRGGPDSAPLPYTTGPGQKRQPERLESKTINVDKRPPSGKRDEFLNSPNDPARVP
jgi:hypothetical protein